MPVCISTRLRDVLALDYPRLIAIVGNSEFHNLVTDCLVAAPPNHASVRNAGLRLPGFLTEHPRSRLRLWLADLALLERTRLEVFDAADSPQLELSTLRALAPGDFAELPLRLIAAHAFLSIDHAASDAWLGTEVPIDDKDSATAPRLPFVVWRAFVRMAKPGLRAFVRMAKPGLRAFVRMAKPGLRARRRPHTA